MLVLPTGTAPAAISRATAVAWHVAGDMPPHRNGATDQLVAAGPLHPVHAQVDAADADGVLRGPGARGVVLGRYQPVPWVDRHGHGRAEVDVAEPDDQVGGRGDDVEH